MNDERSRLRGAFGKPELIWVQVTAQGFVLGDEVLGELEGRLRAVSLVRKLFEEGKLVCDAQDGAQARSGFWCHECLHPGCRPQLRIELCRWALTFRVDLSKTSAENFFALEDETEARGERLVDCTLRLTVVNKGSWGEVRFQRTR